MNGFLGTSPARGVPWYIWLSALAVTSAMIGTEWDISWHRSIGRDTFLTPAHIAIYLCGVLAGICCGYLILATTFGRSGLRASSVHIWGFSAPLGAFIAAWGGIAMLTSAPFDNWWHSAYGLDVKILSPPHMVLALGLVTVELGALVLAAGEKNRAEGVRRGMLDALFLYVAGMVLVALMVVSSDYNWVLVQHSAICYRVLAIVVPGVLAAAALGSGCKWAATTVAGIYCAMQVLLIWILPLFPAQPKLGPVYYPVTHFVPPQFPVLLVVPALALDLFWQRTSQWNLWKRAAVSGVIFLSVALAVEWPLASFLESPLARNWFFGMDYFDYATRPNSFQIRHIFFPMEKTAAQFWTELAIGLVSAIITTRGGMALGNWLREVRR